MSLVSLIVVLVLAGIFVFLVNRAPFIDPPWKQYISYAILVFVVIWIAGALLGWGHLTDMRIGRQ